jgi:8-oxo-dGTP diphosphatase
MIRRFGERVVAGQSYRARPGAYAVLHLDGEVLLTWQEEPDAEFQLPGGGIDTGESPLTALHREVFEETGWTIAAPRRLGAFRRFAYMPDYDRWAEKVCHVYLARPILRLGPPTEAGHAAVWVAAADAPAMVGNDGDRHFLAEVVRRL